MPNTPLNPDGLRASEELMIRTDRITKINYLDAERIITAYLTADQPVVTGEQINRAGWTCDGIHEPGSYATCEDCRGACDDLASFYNQMRITPNASGPWTYRPEVKG